MYTISTLPLGCNTMDFPIMSSNTELWTDNYTHKKVKPDATFHINRRTKTNI